MWTPLRVDSRPQGSGRDSIQEDGLLARNSYNFLDRNLDVIRSIGDVEIDRPFLAGPAVALHIDAPGVKPAICEPIHGRRVRATRDLKVECGHPRHR